MKSINIYLSIFLSIFIFTSCQKDIEFNGEITNPLIVVNSFLTPDSVVSAHISESRFFLNDSVFFKNILNADVSVWVNGSYKEKMIPLQNGSYKGTYLPKIGDIIKLIVNVPSKNEVSSETQIYPQPVIISLDTTNINTGIHYMVNSSFTSTNNGPYIMENDTMGISYGHTINYRLKFTDNVNEKNFYRLVVLSKQYYMNVDTLMNDTTYQILDNYSFNFTDLASGNNSNNDPLSSISGSSAYNYYNVFSDELFNGKEYPLTFSTNEDINVYNSNSIYVYGTPSPYKKEIFIYLQSISKDYYLYLLTRPAASNADGFFSEPIQIQNNIVGGIGILGSYTSTLVGKLVL